MSACRPFSLVSCSSYSMYLFTRFLQIVKEKDRFRKAPPNYAMKKTQLLKDKVKSGKICKGTH